MIKGKSVILREWREGDISKLTELRNDIELQSQLLARVRGSGPEQTRQWLQSRSSDPCCLLYVIADKNHDIPLGYVQFLDIEPIDRAAKLGICISPEVQGKGIGKEVLSLTLRYLSDCWAIRKITLEVRDDNTRAMRCYEKIGFKQCGRYSKHKFIEGEWHDLVIMELFLDTLARS